MVHGHFFTDPLSLSETQSPGNFTTFPANTHVSQAQTKHKFKI